jgi:hypothetical protein
VTSFATATFTCDPDGQRSELGGARGSRAGGVGIARSLRFENLLQVNPVSKLVAE